MRSSQALAGGAEADWRAEGAEGARLACGQGRAGTGRDGDQAEQQR
jgi:hypothetical protein